MNEDLKYIFGNVNEWLKFAETKNAGLLAFNLATIIGVFQIDNQFTKNVKIIEGIIITCLMLSICICLYSISPAVNKGFRKQKKMSSPDFLIKKDALNILFFGDLAKLSDEQFNTLFMERYNITSLNEIEKNFGNQITNNAELCSEKYSAFKYAAWITIITFYIGGFLALLKFIF